LNYFNYFTEIEERFRAARETGLFLLSPLDWALIETWKESGVPLEAALKGIDRSFEKRRRRPQKFQRVNSLAYCAQEVLRAAREMAEGGASNEAPAADSGFEPPRLSAYFRENAAALRESARDPAAPQALLEETAAELEAMASAAEAGSLPSLEEAERRLTALESRLIAAVEQGLSADELVGLRQEMERELAPYRSKMTADQLARLERQYVQRACLERLSAPRLSLFYLQ